MGQPMLAALRAAGLNATGFDIRAPETYPLGAGITNNSAEIPQNTTTLISVVRDIPQTEDLLLALKI